MTDDDVRSLVRAEIAKVLSSLLTTLDAPISANKAELERGAGVSTSNAQLKRPSRVTAWQAAELLGVSSGTIYHMLKDGRLHRAQGYIPIDAVDALFAQRARKRRRIL